MIITAVVVGTRGDVEPLANLGEEMVKIPEIWRGLLLRLIHTG